MFQSPFMLFASSVAAYIGASLVCCFPAASFITIYTQVRLAYSNKVANLKIAPLFSPFPFYGRCKIQLHASFLPSSPFLLSFLQGVQFLLSLFFSVPLPDKIEMRMVGWNTLCKRNSFCRRLAPKYL